MLKVFAVRDVKADAYGNLICVPTVGLATRAFSDACADARSPMAQYPADYSLYELGSFDPASGTIAGLPTPKYVCSAHEIITQREAARAAVEPVLPGVQS